MSTIFIHKWSKLVYMLTGAQIRAARGLVRWSAAELARRAGLGISTIQRMEKSDGVPTASANNLAAVQKAFEAAGIAFIPENGGGPGLRLKEGSMEPPSD